MQSLLCKTLETFVLDRHGSAVWEAILREAGLVSMRFEIFQRYRPETVQALNRGVQTVLDQSHHMLMEDVGTWVCVHPPLEPVRRLIRFSGETFEEMLYSIEAVSDRIELAMPGLVFPDLSLTEHGEGQFTVTCRTEFLGLGGFVLGVLRTMADDYGALAFLELEDRGVDQQAYIEDIKIHLLDESFAAPRAFDLGGVA